jgi:hypothetical protein
MEKAVKLKLRLIVPPDLADTKLCLGKPAFK